MNIIRIRQENRQEKINILIETLKKAFSAGISVDKEKLALESCRRFMISHRTSLEYISLALLDFNVFEEKINGRVMISEKKEA